LVVSCQRHGKDPLAYLSDVLARLPTLTNRNDLTPLTPGGLAAVISLTVRIAGSAAVSPLC